MCDGMPSCITGYIGGTVAQAIGWRYVFYIEAGMAVPLVLFTLLARPLELRSFEKRGHEHTGTLAFNSVLPYV